MTKREFLTAACVVLLCFVAANIAMALWSTHLRPIQKLDTIEKARKANVVLLGNSLMEFAVEPGAFDRAARQQSRNLTAVNAALRGTGSDEHYLLFRDAMRNSPIDTVIIGFFDFQCTARERIRVSGISGSAVFAFDSRVPIQDVERAYELPLLESLQLRLFRLLPLIAYRSVVWESVARLRARRSDSSNYQTVFEMVFNEQARYFGQIPAHFNPSMEKIVHEAKARGCRIVFVLMPVSPRHVTASYRQPRWSAYITSLRRLIGERRFGFIDASEWFPSQTLFMDSVHMSHDGSLLFSPALARAVIVELSGMESRWPRG